MSHTPGPWYCLTNHSPGQRQDHIVRSKPGKCEVARASEQFMDRSERIANARLIAAAPDMLAALHIALPFCPIIGGADDIVRAAIAKAEGKS
jgi:hypothetical protein